MFAVGPAVRTTLGRTVTQLTIDVSIDGVLTINVAFGFGGIEI